MGAANPVPTATLGSRQPICDDEMTLATLVSSVEAMAYPRLDGGLNGDGNPCPCIHLVVCSGFRILSVSKHFKGVVEETTTVQIGFLTESLSIGVSVQ